MLYDPMTYIFLYTVLTGVTTGVTYKKIIDGVMKSLTAYGDKGLRISKDKLKNSSCNGIDLDFGVGQLNPIAKVSLVIPGINLIMAKYVVNRFKKAVDNNKDFQECLVPMSETEKQMYQASDTLDDKFQFMLLTAQLSEDQELVAVAGNQLIIHDKETMHVDEPLVHLAYTLEDIKKLNAATTYSYRIGKLDDQNVAFIGIPNPEYEIKKVACGERQDKHVFTPMTEEEAKNEKFIVYNLADDHDQDVEKAIKEMLEERTRRDKEKRMSYIRENTTTKTEKINGPVKTDGTTLKKTL